MNWNKLLLPLRNERGGFLSSIGRGFKKLVRGVGRTVKAAVKGFATGGPVGAVVGGAGTAVFGQGAMSVSSAITPAGEIAVTAVPITRPAGAYPVQQLSDRTTQGAAFGELFKGNTMLVVLGAVLVMFMLAKK